MNHMDKIVQATDQVRVLMDFMAVAIRGKNVDQVMSFYAADVVSFDLLPPLRHQGSDAVRERLAQWFDGFEGGLTFQIHDLDVTAGDDVAFCHSLHGVQGNTKDGIAIDMWWRATHCFKKGDGAWLITHAHSSEPFDMSSGKALTDLKP